MTWKIFYWKEESFITEPSKANSSCTWRTEENFNEEETNYRDRPWADLASLGRKTHTKKNYKDL
jgi:hypothetical protein